MNILAFDPAKRTGWAYKTMEDKWDCGVVNPDDTLTVKDVIMLAISQGVDKAVLESTYLAVNPATRSRLDEIRGQLRGMCMQYGMEVQNVAPNTWKAAMLRTNGRMPKGRKAQKEQAMLVARALGAEPRNADEADAVCLCEWARRKKQENEA